MAATIDDVVSAPSLPADGDPTVHPDATEAAATSPRRPDRVSLTRWAGDLAALLPLLVLLPYLAERDGGRGLAATLTLGVAAAVALPATLPEVRRLPRVAVALLGTWLVGLTLGVVAAQYRADMVLPLLQYTIAPVLLLCTRRLWRRAWGPGILLALLGIAFAQYQSRSWLVWWAKTEAGTGLWQPLSWRNPSAALTGMFAVWFLGIGLASTRIVRLGLLMLAATGFAGTWLSSSRAGLAVTVVAAIITLAVGIRSAVARGEAAWRPLLATIATGVTTFAIVGGLLSMQPVGTQQALATREEGVGQNSLARIEHAEAAVGMFLDRPLTGQGLGSYKVVAREWNDPNGNLTSSAHNEYAEVAGEAGIFGVVALLGVLLGLALVGWRTLRRPPRGDGPADLRGPLVVGAVGTAALFLAHSAVDFDWDYPVLSGLAAVAAAVMLPDRPGTRVPRATARATAVGLTALLVTGVTMGIIETREDGPAPWDDGQAVATGAAALEAGRPQQALSSASAALAWNPASPGARSLRALAQYELDGDAAALQEAIAAQPRSFSMHAQAALALAEGGDIATAEQVAADLHRELDVHAAWGVSQTRLLTVEAEVAAAATRSCGAAVRVVRGATADATRGDRPLPMVADDVLAERLQAHGCPGTW